MLYVTTRNKYDTYTAYKANQSDRGPDDGLYLPFRFPELSQEEIQGLAEQSFCQRIANVLNLFFGTEGLDGKHQILTPMKTDAVGFQGAAGGKNGRIHGYSL